jgi:hypothetical protein
MSHQNPGRARHKLADHPASDEKSSIILDSGATENYFRDAHMFDTYQRSNKKVVVADGRKIRAMGVGKVRLPVRDHTNIVEAIHVPGLNAKLLSVIKLVDAVYEINFLPESCSIKRQGTVIADVVPQGGTYAFSIDTPKVCQNSSIIRAHMTLGHIGGEALHRMIHMGVYKDGFEHQPTREELNDAISQCHICVLTRATRAPFPIRESHSKDILERIHVDITGLLPYESLGGSRFIATILMKQSNISAVSHFFQVRTSY